MDAGALQATSAFLQHLSVLRKKNLVSIKRVSSVLYTLADPRIAALITSLHTIFVEN
ncbi:hypothetical protein [Colwellia piezophila]|uniref:hypothetical protein n=1 Tax=Colwellia piezophila TaxID=211668 RepID=UPI000361D185|nr:hypothetical protein [Colwellia piezophila]